MKYLPHGGVIYNTNFTDDILSVEWKESELENDDLKNYKAKAEFYVRQHQDHPAIAKLRSNVPLTAEDVRERPYSNDVNLDSRQIYFVNQIVEYIVHNGVLKDLSVLQEPPFTDQGSIVEIFTDLSLRAGIRGVIDRINANAAA